MVWSKNFGMYTICWIVVKVGFEVHRRDFKKTFKKSISMEKSPYSRCLRSNNLIKTNRIICLLNTKALIGRTSIFAECGPLWLETVAHHRSLLESRIWLISSRKVSQAFVCSENIVSEASVAAANGWVVCSNEGKVRRNRNWH